jgi:hypothetical protein
MGFVTNQWIKDRYRLREAEYVPVEATIDAVEDRDEWAADNGVVLEIQATRANGDYQSIHLTPHDLRTVLRVIVEKADREVRIRLATDLLLGASDVEFVKLIVKALERRLAGQRKRVKGNG